MALSLEEHPAVSRNKKPIGAYLLAHFPERARMLELASGSGHHGVYCLEIAPKWHWLPTEKEPSLVEHLEAAYQSGDYKRMERPLKIDLLDPSLSLDGEFEAVFDGLIAINLCHIAKRSVPHQLFQVATRVLKPGGMVYMYGPFWRQGVEREPSNLSFDQYLKSLSHEYGIWALEELESIASTHSYTLMDVTPMPANNLSVLWAKTPL